MTITTNGPIVPSTPQAPITVAVSPASIGTRVARISTWIGATWLILIALLAIFYPILGLPKPARSDYSNIAVGPFTDGHILGTDAIGRDMLTRLLAGGRVSLTVGLGGVALAVTVGATLGLLAGFFGGLLARVVNGLMDVLLAFPSLIALIALSVFIGPGLKMTIIGFGLVAAPQVARVTRAATLAFSQREFVTAARSMGAPPLRILVRDVLPNVVGPVLAYATVLVAVAIVAEGSLSFLGLGVPPPQSSWGGMMADGRTKFERAPHIVLMPALFMFLTLLAIYFVAEALNRRFDIKEAAL